MASDNLHETEGVGNISKLRNEVKMIEASQWYLGKRHDGKKVGEGGERKWCVNCNSTTHETTECWSNKTCTICGKKGHLAAKCWKNPNGAAKLAHAENNPPDPAVEAEKAKKAKQEKEKKKRQKQREKKALKKKAEEEEAKKAAEEAKTVHANTVSSESSTEEDSPRRYSGPAQARASRVGAVGEAKRALFKTLSEMSEDEGVEYCRHIGEDL